jgi:hypothetical protein
VLQHAGNVLGGSESDPELTPSVHRNTSERAVPEGTTYNLRKPAVQGNQYADLLLDHLIGYGQQRFRGSIAAEGQADRQHGQCDQIGGCAFRVGCSSFRMTRNRKPLTIANRHFLINDVYDRYNVEIEPASCSFLQWAATGTCRTPEVPSILKAAALIGCRRVPGPVCNFLG